MKQVCRKQRLAQAALEKKKTRKKRLCYKSRALSAAIKEISVDAVVAAGFFS